MTLLFDEAKVRVLDDARKPPQCIIQLERYDRIVSPAANAIPKLIPARWNTGHSAISLWFCVAAKVKSHSTKLTFCLTGVRVER
jgi:hypothetical protein